MKPLLITGVKNPSSEGVTLLLNEPVALNGGMTSKIWFVSWDRIGAALFGDKYYHADVVATLDKIRGR